MKSQEILDLKIIRKRRMEGKLLIRGGRRCIYVITFMEQIIFYNYEGWAQISTTHPRKMFPAKDHGYFHLISTTFKSFSPATNGVRIHVQPRKWRILFETLFETLGSR